MPPRALLLAAAVAAATLVACGSDGDSAGATTPPPGGDTTTTTATTTATSAAGRGVKLVKVGGFDQPLYVTAPPANRRRIFVVGQGGRIDTVLGGRKLTTPFLDLSSRVTSGGEQGLLGLAFAPDYARSGLFYVYYTGKDFKQHLVEYHRKTGENVADNATARTVFVHDDPEGNHNGGQLAFGPDGLLYIGTGDGGGGNDQHGAPGNAQDLGSPLGKILRIDPRADGSKPFTAPSEQLPVRQPLRRPAGDLRLRPAQPVALLV